MSKKFGDNLVEDDGRIISLELSECICDKEHFKDLQKAMDYAKKKFALCESEDKT